LGFGFGYKFFWVLGLGFGIGYKNFWVLGLGLGFGYKIFLVFGLGLGIIPNPIPNFFLVQTSGKNRKHKVFKHGKILNVN